MAELIFLVVVREIEIEEKRKERDLRRERNEFFYFNAFVLGCVLSKYYFNVLNHILKYVN